MAIAIREARAVRGEYIIIERPDGTRRHVSPHHSRSSMRRPPSRERRLGLLSPLLHGAAARGRHAPARARALHRLHTGAWHLANGFTSKTHASMMPCSGCSASTCATCGPGSVGLTACGPAAIALRSFVVAPSRTTPRKYLGMRRALAQRSPRSAHEARNGVGHGPFRTRTGIPRRVP